MIYPSTVTSALIVLIGHARQMPTTHLVGGPRAAAQWREGELLLAEALECFAMATAATPPELAAIAAAAAQEAAGRALTQEAAG